jgi:hypothetical protein
MQTQQQEKIETLKNMYGLFMVRMKGYTKIFW